MSRRRRRSEASARLRPRARASGPRPTVGAEALCDAPGRRRRGLAAGVRRGVAARVRVVDHEAVPRAPVERHGLPRAVVGGLVEVEAADGQLGAAREPDHELDRRAEVDDLADRALDAAAARVARRLERDALRADRDAQDVARAAAGRQRGEDPAVLAEAHDGVLAVDVVHAHVDDVRGADEVGDERRRGALVEAAGRRDLLDDALVHDRDAVGHRQRLVLVVRDVDERRLRAGLDRLELALHLAAELEVQGAERLVEEQRRGTVDERAGERDALLLAAGELRRAALVEALEPHDPQRLAHALGELSALDAAHPRAEGHVLGDRHMREQRVGLEDHVHVAARRRDVGDVLAAQVTPAGLGSLEARRASAGSSDFPQPLGPGSQAALGDVERRVTHGGTGGRLAVPRPVALGDGVQLDRVAGVGHAAPGPLSRAAEPTRALLPGRS